MLHDGRRAVMKVQYPGVARSIESDVDNLMRLIRVANILPKGLYVENAGEGSALLLLQGSWLCTAGEGRLYFGSAGVPLDLTQS